VRIRYAFTLVLALVAALLPALSAGAAVAPTTLRPTAAVAEAQVVSPQVAAPVLSAPAPLVAAATAATPTRTRVYDGGLLIANNKPKAVAEQFSSAVVGNVTDHRDGDTDVVAGYLDGTIHVWSVRTGRQEFVVQTGGQVSSSPALVRTSPGSLSVLTSNNSGDVLIYQFTGGRARITFHKHVATRAGVNGFFGTPTMADLDRNGKMWVIATSWDQHLYVWDLAGNPKHGFPYFAQDTIWSSPTVATVEGDPYPEIFFGYDCSGIPAQTCFRRWHTYGGVLIAIKHDGRVATGWPVFIPHEVVWSTPAVTSLMGTAAKQVIVGTGLYWGAGAGQKTWVFDAHGHLMKSIPMSGRTFSSPAIGDVLGLGKPQIVIGTEFGYTDIIDTLWHRRAHVCTAQLSTCVSSHSSPIIGDLYGNGRQEVVAVGGNSFHVIDRTGKSVVTVQIPETVMGLAASPTLVNINGRATLFITLMARRTGGAHAEVISYTFPTKAGPSAWPMFKGNMGRSGSPTKMVPIPPAY
jgi:hypothetical protein